MSDSLSQNISANAMLEAVKEVLKSLTTEISPQAYKLWIADINAEKFENNILYLTVQGPIRLEIVQKKYADYIKTVIFDLFDLHVDLVITSVDEDANIMPNQEMRPPVSTIDHQLNTRYTFDNFVVGSSNRTAYEAAQVMATEPAGVFPSLYLYGGPGLGKTHLIQAIGNYIHKNNPEMNILYITCEQFTTDFLQIVIKEHNSAQFHEKYRNVDVLIIDDIQFLSGKDSTQEEFFHTYNTLQANNKKMIFTSDKPPKDITGLEDRLIGRLTNGFITEILPPDYEMRVVITKTKAEENNLDVPDELIDYIAEKVVSNVRELEGVLNQLKVSSRIAGAPINFENVNNALTVYTSESYKNITPDLILETVSKFLGVSRDDILSKRKTKDIVYARHLGMYFTKQFTDMTLKEISIFYKRNDHTTAINAVNKINSILAENDKTIIAQITDIENNIKKD